MLRVNFLLSFFFLFTSTIFSQNTSLGDVSYSSSTGIYTWTVANTGTYKVEIRGAVGGGSTNVGRGVIIEGTITLTAGDVYKILVGQKGGAWRTSTSGSGGGGSFLVKSDNTPIMIAAGGNGGTGSVTRRDGRTGYSNGNGGSGSLGGGGGGFNTNGQDGQYGKGGFAFVNGGFGALGTTTANSFGTASNLATDGAGGFGGGGGQFNAGCCVTGGGGGYQGGQAETTGAGSYVIPGVTNLKTSDGNFNSLTTFGGSPITNLASYNSGDGVVIITCTTCTDQPSVTFNATGSGRLPGGTTNIVDPLMTPTISIVGTLNSFSGCAGSSSSSQSFSISGSALTSNVTVTAPTGFELALTSGGTYNTSVVITASGTLSSTLVYVRLRSNATGSPSGNISVTSTGATTQNIQASGTVSTPPSAATLTGSQSVLVGNQITLAASTSGGTWSTSNPTVALVNSSGVVTGQAVGNATISYTLSGTGGCSNAISNRVVTVTTCSSQPLAGTLTGAQTICEGASTTFSSTGSSSILGNSLSFVGTTSASSSSFVTVSSGFPVSSGDFTIELWVRPTLIDAQYHGFFGSQGTTRDQSMWVGPNGSLHTDYNSGGTRYDMLTADNFFTLNTWTHVAWVKEGTSFKLYKNGTLVSTRTGIPSNLSVANNFYWLGRVDNFFSGSLDEFRIWNTARTPAQLQENMNKEVSSQTNLLAYYNFNQGTAGGTNTGVTTLNDESGNSRSGALTNFSLTGTTSNWVTGAEVNGVWTSSNTAVATVDLLTGVVTGVANGTATITYTVYGANGCTTATATRTVTVSTPVSAGTLIGTQAVCIAGTSQFSSNGASGGTWTSSNTGVATVSTTGLVTGVTAGTATITYTVAGSGGCPNATATRTVTVTALPNAGTLSGTQSICVSGTSQFSSNGASGGTWTSSNTGVATVSTTGLVTGVTAGTATITYTVAGSGGCANASSTRTITVSASPAPASISGTQTVCVGGTTQFTASSPDAVGANGISLHFDGVNDFASVPDNNSLDITNAITVEAWIYPTKNSGIQNVLSKSSTGLNNSYIFPRTDDGWQNFIAYLSLNGGWQTISYPYPALNTWHHLAFTYDGSAIRLYLNGVLVNSRAASGSIDANTNVLALGNQTGFNEFYGGRVDELRLWNVARTQAQIAANKDIEIAAQANLIAYYKFNEGVPSGTNTSIATLLDASSNGFNATMQNFAKTGATSNWVGSTQSLSGTWTSSNTSVATVSNSGLVSAVAPGTATITFVLPGAPCADVSSTRIVTVTAPPSAGDLSGNQAICVGGNTTFTSTVSGGTWSSSNSGVATVSSSGIVTGVAAGTSTITYTVAGTGGCADATTTRTVTVTAAPNAGTLSGTQAICLAGTSQLTTSGTSGGTWTSSANGIATVSSSGLVTAVSAGTSTITYTVAGTGGCANATATRTVTVTLPPASGTLSGTQTVFAGATTTFASTVTGGSWTSSNTAVATVSASTGVVTGVAAGTAIITYTVAGTGGCSDATATRTVTVYTCPTIPALSASAYPVCAESNFTLTAAGLSGMSSLSTGVTFKYSTTVLADPYVGGTVIATVPFASLEAANTIARTTTSLTVGGTYYIYAILSTTPEGTGCRPFATTTLVVNPKGQVTLPSNIVVCHGASISAQSLTTTNSGGTTTYAWTNSATSIGLAASGSTATIPAFTATNTGSAGVTATIAVIPTYTDGGLSCPGATSSYTITVNPVPALSAVTNQVICNATTGSVNFNSTTNPAQNLSVSSGAISVAIPDGVATGVTSALTATIPTGATITGIAVNFNINHTWNSDLVVNLVAPNGQVLNLVNARGGSSDNFTNTTISSSSTTSLATGTAPFTGTFAADAASGVGPTAFLSTAANFAALYSGTTSGSWRLAIRDRFSGDAGTLTSWSITFTYTPVPSVTWTNSNTATGLAASGTGNISFTATNPGPDQISSTITATPTYENAGLTCSGTPITFTIAVNPSGQVNAVSNQVLCNTSATSAVTFSTTNNGLISTGGTQTAASGTISVSVPDASAVGATHTIPVSLPTGAVINNMRVTFNMTHTYVGDMVINLKAPNGQVLNLFNQHGGGGDNFVNTVVSSTGTTAFASGSAPFTGTFAATAASGQGPTGNVSNATNFAALYSTPNGNWVLAMRDLAGGDLGVLTSWSISIDYTVQGTFGTNMNWTNSNATIGLAATGTGNIPSFTAVNNGGTPIVSTVTVTPSYFNGGTSCAGTPTTFTYTVNPTPTVNAVAGQVFCAGTPSTVNFSGIAAGTVYSWTNSNTAIGLAASGTGNLSFTPTNTGTTPIIATITVTPSFTNAGVTCTGTPRTFTITVNPVGQVNAVTSQVLCNGSNTTAVNFATVNGGGTIVAGTPVTANSGTIAVVVPDATAAGIGSTLPVTLPAGATITGISVNFSMNHTWVSDMVFNLRAPNGQILNLVNRRGGAGTNFTNTTISSAGTASLATAAAPFTGTFAADAAIGVGPTGLLSTAANFDALYSVGSGDWTLQMRDYVTGDVGTLTNWSITINYTTLVPAVTSYAWTNNLSSIGLAASGTGNIASFAAANTTAAPVTATVTVTPTYSNAGVGCAGTPISYTYTVNPTPTVNAVANQTVCVGSSVGAVTFTGATTGTVYNWTNSNTAIGLAASGTGNIASFVGTNTTAAPISGTITVTPVYTNAGVTCTGTPRTYTITVNPIPTVNPVANFAACHNTTAAAAFSGATTGTVYNWTNSNPAIGLPASGSGNISFTALNTTSAPVTATITVTPSYTNAGATCVGTPTSFVITVNPLPVVTAGTLPGRICISDTLVRLNGTPVGGSWSGFGISGFSFIPPATDVGTWPITYTFADANGCVNSASTTVTVLACEERNRNLDNGAVILYPNPNSGQFNLRINSALFNVLGMRVYNAAGQLMYINQWRSLVFGRVIPINLDHLAAGTYMVRLFYGDGMDRGADKTYQVIIAH